MNVNDWTAAIGKKLLSAQGDEYRMTLKFEDGITAEITSNGGIGYNEGQSWLKVEVTKPTKEAKHIKAGLNVCC